MFKHAVSGVLGQHTSAQKAFLPALSQLPTCSSLVRLFSRKTGGDSEGPVQGFEPRLSLHMLQDNPGARKFPKRVGRGPASGRGKTSGRGMKGQKARASDGLKGKGFAGGQAPLHKTQPKVGFTRNGLRQELKPLNLDKLQAFIDHGKLDPSRPITMKQLFDANIVGSIPHGVKLLSDGAHKLKSPVNLEVTRASKKAIAAVEALGGTVVCAWYNRLNLRALLKPHKFEVIPKRARPPGKHLPYYTSYENRGYLSPEIQMKAIEQKNASQ